MTAATESSAELVVALTLRLKGFAQQDQVVTATGLPEDVVLGQLEQSRIDCHVGYRDGRIGGWHLTPPGRQHLLALLAAEREAIVDGAGLDAAYDAFVPVNAEFKGFCTAWQQEDPAIRDLAAYAARLGDIDDRLTAVLADASRTLARFTQYSARFEGARALFVGGDLDALAKPLSGSYHDVWMELHQDLLATLARERSAADGQ